MQESQTNEKYLKHLTQDWKEDVQQLQKDKGRIQIYEQDILKRHGQRLICPKCERGAFRCGRNRARCNFCGWEGQSITIDEYITAKLYK